MSESIDFTGRTAIITGAGQGIGRAYAELLASRGANVVVNDLGTRTAGGGSDPSRAEQAVEAIRASGGSAVANGSDISTVEGAEQLVADAIDAFGGLDIVINNAGIFTTDQFPDIDLELLQRLFGVHLAGSFNVTKAAWPHLAEQEYGRVVLTTSTSALGAADTIGYTMAKAGVFGLGRALAQAGIPLGIKVNLVAPMAMTRMMSTGMGLGDAIPEVQGQAPDLVAPLVALLCHESCPVTGETFMSGMRRVSRLFMAETEGYTHDALDLSPEIVRDQWPTVLDESHYEQVHDTMAWSAINSKHLAATPVAEG